MHRNVGFYHLYFLLNTLGKKNKNTWVKWKAFVTTVGIKGADLEDEFLFQILAAFRRTLM